MGQGRIHKIRTYIFNKNNTATCSLVVLKRLLARKHHVYIQDQERKEDGKGCQLNVPSIRKKTVVPRKPWTPAFLSCASTPSPGSRDLWETVEASTALSMSEVEEAGAWARAGSGGGCLHTCSGCNGRAGKSQVWGRTSPQGLKI